MALMRTFTGARDDTNRSGFPAVAVRIVGSRVLEASMFNIWQTWFEAARFGCDVQNVIALRSMRFMQGGPRAGAEARRMVSEKFAAFAAAQAAAAYALAMGKTPEAAAELAM